MTSLFTMVAAHALARQPIATVPSEATAIRMVVSLVVLAGVWLPYQLMPMTRWWQRIFRWLVVAAVLAFGFSNLFAAAQTLGVEIAMRAS